MSARACKQPSRTATLVQAEFAARTRTHPSRKSWPRLHAAPTGTTTRRLFASVESTIPPFIATQLRALSDWWLLQLVGADFRAAAPAPYIV